MFGERRGIVTPREDETVQGEAVEGDVKRPRQSPEEPQPLRLQCVKCASLSPPICRRALGASGRVDRGRKVPLQEPPPTSTSNSSCDFGFYIGLGCI